MTMTVHKLESESPTDELAMLLVGEKKAGKSYLAATAPGNVFFVDPDQRLGALKTHPNYKNIYGMSFSDGAETKQGKELGSQCPTAFLEILEVLSKLETSPLLKDLHGTFADCGDKWIDTIVFDSIQTMADCARRYVLFNGETGQGGITRLFQIGKRQFRVAKSYHAWGGEQEMVTGAILQARALLHCKVCAKSVTYTKPSPSINGINQLFHTDPSLDKDHPPQPKAMNVICTLHECMEEDERSTEENPIYTGKIEVYPRRYNTLLVYFNEVWRLTRETGKTPTIKCDPDGKFIQAATALGIEKVHVADISKILSDVKSLRKPQTQTQAKTV